MRGNIMWFFTISNERLKFGEVKIILQATDLPALTRSDPVSLIEDILMAASEGDEN